MSAIIRSYYYLRNGSVEMIQHKIAAFIWQNWGALALILFGSAIRLILISQNWPITNSDEATIGLMAMHILAKGEHPIFSYGQNYIGSTEAFTAAVFFRFF